MAAPRHVIAGDVGADWQAQFTLKFLFPEKYLPRSGFDGSGSHPSSQTEASLKGNNDEN